MQKTEEPSPSGVIGPPKNSRSRRTREAILASTYALLEQAGVSGVTMESVAKRAGCSRRALYLHFESRAELLVAMIDYADRQLGLAEHLDVITRAQGPVERLRAFGQFLGAYHTKIAHLVRSIDREREVDESVRATWEVFMAKWRQGAALAVADLKRSKLLHRRFRDADDAVDLMYSLMSVDLIRCLVDERGWSPAKYGAYMGETFVALLVDAGAEKRPRKRTP